MSVCVCLCVFVTHSGACHLCAAWLSLTVLLQAMAGSSHLCQSNESLKLKASSGKHTETGERMKKKESKETKKNKDRK